MTWQWVAIILGLAFNVTLIMLAMSPGMQYKIGERSIERQLESGDYWREIAKAANAVPGEETTRSSQSDAGSTRRV